jgi:cytochrome c peroxidase
MYFPINRLLAVSPFEPGRSSARFCSGTSCSPPTYPELFETAFGDSEITPVRIAFAIASYERTLVADLTPWDQFVGGDATALTPAEAQGLNVFNASACVTRHVPPTFTDDSFRTIGVRSPNEDDGRASVTGLLADRGGFKVPSLRNVGLKPSFMHTGEFVNLQQVIGFYQPGNQDPENLDPLMPAPIQPLLQVGVAAFLEGALTDPRVEAETASFDRPIPAPEPGLEIGRVSGGLFLGGLTRRRARLSRPE